MNTRALTLAISMLGSAAMSVALVSTSGCRTWSSRCDSWSPPQSLDVGVGAGVNLHAVVALQGIDTSIPSAAAVGANGTIVLLGGTGTNVSSIGTADLRAIWASSYAGSGGRALWVVGDAGTAAVSHDDGKTWQLLTLPTNANLHAIIGIREQLVIAGDDVVLVQGADGTWTEATAPDGGWGQLRALHADGERLYAVGLGGVIRSTSDPSGEWIAESSGTESDLFALGDFYLEPPTVAAVGAKGTVVVRKSGAWQRVHTHVNVDFLAYDEHFVLASDGRLFHINGRGKLSKVQEIPDAKAMIRLMQGALMAGTNGTMSTIQEVHRCEGRPFVVDGHARTASLQHDGPQPSHELAAAWANDGLYEHASVASFARFALELLALGAPPRLIRDVQGAIADELRHARACFDLARRFGGVEVRPGALPLSRGALARVGDPVATAIGVFEEACVNESIAACAAAEAASRAEDPEVRRVLEGIAVDERRHAVAGWAALRWLLDTYGEEVRDPLRARLARLGPTDDELGNTVLGKLVVPLAHSMLFEGVSDVTARLNLARSE